MDNLFKGYGDIPPFGNGVDQQKIHTQGNAYVRNNFPNTDFIFACNLVEPEQPHTKPAEVVSEELVPELTEAATAVITEKTTAEVTDKEVREYFMCSATRLS